MDTKAEAMTLIIQDRPGDEVEAFLKENGCSESEAQKLTAAMLEKRHQLVRRRAAFKLSIGALVATLCYGRMIYVVANDLTFIWFRGPVLGAFLGALILGAIWSTWAIISAIFNLVRPQRVRGNLGYHAESI